MSEEEKTCENCGKNQTDRGCGYDLMIECNVEKRLYWESMCVGCIAATNVNEKKRCQRCKRNYKDMFKKLKKPQGVK